MKDRIISLKSGKLIVDISNIILEEESIFREVMSGDRGVKTSLLEDKLFLSFEMARNFKIIFESEDVAAEIHNAEIEQTEIQLKLNKNEEGNRITFTSDIKRKGLVSAIKRLFAKLGGK